MTDNYDQTMSEVARNMTELQLQLKNLMTKFEEMLDRMAESDDGEDDVYKELTEEEYIAELEEYLKLSPHQIKKEKRKAKKNDVSYAEWLYMLQEQMDDDETNSEDEGDSEDSEEDSEDDSD